MTNDLEIIKQIEKQIGIKLRQVPHEKISSINSGYALDEQTGRATGLKLNGYGITDISFLEGLGGLTHLSLRHNRLTGLMPIAELTNLHSLNLSSNQLRDLTPLANLKNLQYLNLSVNQITDLTPLKQLTNLKKISLSENKIKDLSSLMALTELTEISLFNNQITNLMPLGALTNLTELNLSKNAITDITPLNVMGKLIALHLSRNLITEIAPLDTLTNLKLLRMYKNKIMNLTSLRTLTKLTELSLFENQIKDLTPLKELKDLAFLDVRNNRIEKLPLDITDWWPNMEIKWENARTLGLNLYGNPFTDPPSEIVKKGKAAIQNYFDEIERASVLFLECKLLLVGAGDVGKTTLMKKLKNNAFQVVPGIEDTTRGIDIQPWTLSCPFPDGKSHEVNIHFWDFGGQDILHATHQFFLTKRSLYLFVWDPRKEEETQSFDYWLNAVKLFGANSPLIMVMNKADLRIKEIDEASFKYQFPNIKRFHQVSCFNGQQILELTETIRSSLSRMPHLLDKLPKRWLDIRDQLKARKENYLSLDDYMAVCASHDMDKEKALFLSDYLHDLGIILHFRHDPVLADAVILKPEWATGAVYALIDALEIQKNKGRYSRVELGRYWDARTYPAEKHGHLLRLMEKFELCFNIVGTDDYIIPELLPSQRPAVDIDAYRSAGNLQLQYSYHFMPAGILTRFICRLHYLIYESHYWKNGVELEFSGSRALVVSDTAARRLRVSVSGNDKSQLMGIIRGNFDHIHDTMNMKKEEHVFEEVPCDCGECKHAKEPYFFKYKMLQKSIEKGIDPQCARSLEDLSAHRLLNGFLLSKGAGNLFDTLITTAAQVMSISKTLQPDENSRNTVVAMLLGTRGFRVKDQTLRGSSESGIRIGELDILVEDEVGRQLSIIEALNLASVDTVSIDRHIMKLLDKYDSCGLKENYILAYVSASEFAGFCSKYEARLKKMNYGSYPLLADIEKVNTGFNKLAGFRARHRCNSGETVLYHLLLQM